MIPHEDIKRDGNENKNYLILFTATWCGYCPAMKREVAKLTDYIIYQFDSDKEHVAARKLNIRSLPTTVIFDNGKEVKRFVGYRSAETLKSYLKKRSEQ